ncbi:MAG: response regulator transcription factor [Gemmatimonadetes bacterium]|nr:response regulator transcription factor [Gemmatimonadota bacterium]
MSNDTDPISVAVVEDVTQVREGLALLISSSDGFDAIGAYDSAERAIEAFATRPPDVVLMDIGLPGMSGIEATRLLKERWPSVQVMMLTVYEDDDRIFRSLQAGATGYVLKNTSPTDLLHDISTLNRGGSPMSSSIARRVVETFHATPPSEPGEEPLTKREEEILALLSEGFRYREIADKLTIGIETVRTHIHHIYRKMHVRSRTEAAVKYVRRTSR